MPKERIQTLDQRCRWRTYEADEFIFEHQDNSRDVHFVTRGSVRVVLFGKSGQEVLFRTLQEGHHLGELAAIDGKPRSATIVAITRATIATMPQSVFLELLESEP